MSLSRNAVVSPKKLVVGENGVFLVFFGDVVVDEGVPSVFG